MTETVLNLCRQFLSDYAATLDDDRLEEFPDFFSEDAVYQILPRENVERGLPLSLLFCDGKDMIRDRIVSLRNANIYNIHSDRHVIGEPRVLSVEDEVHQVEASYALFQTNQAGQTHIFSVGVYKLRLDCSQERPVAREFTVVTDTASIETLLSTPI